MSDSFATPWAIACQAPLYIGFSRQEYWRGLLFPSPGELLNPGIKPESPELQVDSLATWEALLSRQQIVVFNPMTSSAMLGCSIVQRLWAQDFFDCPREGRDSHTMWSRNPDSGKTLISQSGLDWICGLNKSLLIFRYFFSHLKLKN